VEVAQRTGVQTGSGVMIGDPEREVDMSLLWRTWKLLLDNYVDPRKLQTQPMVYGAVEGLVRGVGDPYTVFMTPEEDTDFREGLAGNLEGIGAELSLDDGVVRIERPLKGSPAEKAGLLPRDIIGQVNGESIADLTLTEVVRRIRGPKGTSVRLLLGREGRSEPFEVTIVRQEIHVPSVESKTIGGANGTVGYIALNQFGDTSIDELRDELQTLKKQNLKGLILDLRGNGGGYLDGAVELVSMFLGEGNVVSVEHRKNPPEQHYVSGNPLWPDIPLVVLQNEGTASASEITAGALQDYGRATIVGRTSFGKGTVQEIISLGGGASLRVTVARWLTPKGKDLGKEGVHPDIDVELTPEDAQAKKDPQLDAATQWLLTGKKPASGAAGSSSNR
jgi:carboxyl-terminal processing protease